MSGSQFEDQLLKLLDKDDKIEECARLLSNGDYWQVREREVWGYFTGDIVRKAKDRVSRSCRFGY